MLRLQSYELQQALPYLAVPDCVGIEHTGCGRINVYFDFQWEFSDECIEAHLAKLVEMRPVTTWDNQCNESGAFGRLTIHVDPDARGEQLAWAIEDAIADELKHFRRSTCPAVKRLCEVLGGVKWKHK